MPPSNTEEAIAFLRRWCPEGPYVLTSIVPDGKIITRTFTAAEEKEIYHWLESRQGKENCYFHVNPVRRKLDVKASKEDIERLAWLHVDIDPRAGEDREQERSRALKMLREFIPKPSVIVDSGGGYQGFWRLEKSPKLEIGGVLTRAQELEAYNLQLEKVFGADHCHNVDRIMRIPGTINLPDARKRKKGRVPVLASVVEWSDETYSIDRFTPAVRVQTKEPGLAGSPKLQITGNVPVVGVDELRDWAKENGKHIDDHWLAVIATGTHPIDSNKYPSRSEALFALCCALVRAQVPEDLIYAVITGPNEIAASVRDKGRNAHSYALRQIERAMEESIDPNLRILNERHAVIGDMGGKCRIISEVFDHVLQRTKISKQSFEDFRNRYNNKQVQVGVDQQGNPTMKPLGTFWITHPARRQYDHILFAPNKELDKCYNLWRGFSVDALPGKAHESFLSHVRDNVCSGNLHHYEYLLGWMARLVQQPDTPGEVSVVLRGKRGTGKSFMAKVLGKMFGRHFLQVSDSKHLVGSFNAHLRDTVLLFGDEAFFAGDKKHESVLKTLITEESLIIEGKGVDAEAAPNFTHLILASNEDWVVPAGLDERRFFVLEVSDAKRQDIDYFKQLNEELDRGGLENLLYYLLHYDLSQYEVRRVPQTKALLDQKMLTMSPEMQWMYDKLWEGKLLDREQEWKCRVVKDALYDEYLRAMTLMRRPGYNHSKTSFGRFLQKACPPNSLQTRQETCDVPVIGDGGMELVVRKRAYVYYFPPLDLMRKFWDEEKGGPHEWPKWEGSQDPIEDDEGQGKSPF